jgi:hypothetical protein
VEQILIVADVVAQKKKKKKKKKRRRRSWILVLTKLRMVWWTQTAMKPTYPALDKQLFKQVFFLVQ